MPDNALRRPVRFGVFELDPASGELLKRGVRLRLRDKPLQVLLALVERPGEVITRHALQQRLWPDGTFVEFENGLNNAMSRLRDVLGDAADTPRYIETIPRRGYRFIAPLEPAPAPAPEPVLVTPQVEAPAPAPRAARQSRRARAASAPVPVKAVEPPAEARPQPVAATPPPPVDADSVQRKLDRLTRQSRSRSLAPETSQAVKRLFSEVHAAYFRDDFARADALLDTIARHLEPR
jgi:DNA-binding winged helix-turn-helix (wHTH) protein